VHVVPPAAHVHPVPAIDTNDKPEGAVSVTVTVPLVGPAVALLLTANVYVAPVCPCVKFPVWLLAILSTGRATIMVGSVVLAGTDPPPDTLA
jgi:hypothetical protein